MCMSNYRFTVYEHTLVFDENKIIKRQFIVLKDDNGNIIGWTDYHSYAKSATSTGIRSVYSDTGKRCYYIVKLLNYIFFDQYHLSKLSDINAKMVCDFLNDYGLCSLPDDTEHTVRSESTVKNCVTTIIDFLTLIIRKNHGFKMKIDDFFRTEKVFDKRKKRTVDKRVPQFDICHKDSGNTNKMLRDLPEGVFQILFNEILENHRNILMLAALSAFAGLRPSECCNVRREDSVLGAGLRFQLTDGEVTDIFIDLTEEKVLRSDLINVGKIKKHRTQRVYPAFLGAFMTCYNLYMSYIVGKPYEANYGALNNTSFGKAMTYNSYRDGFKRAVEGAIPKMIASDDARVQHYGFLLQEMSISPHIFKHWFSVKLVLFGEEVSGLMFWRGDKNPESALTYISNKSELVKQYEKVSDELINYNLWRADKLFGGDKA